MDRDELERRKRLYWQVEPVLTITAAVGGKWLCPDERCGENELWLLVPHPADPERNPNRCPTCLCTAARATDEKEEK